MLSYRARKFAFHDCAPHTEAERGRSRRIDKQNTPSLPALDFDDEDEPSTGPVHAHTVASIIRSTAEEALRKLACQKGANALLNFQYKSRIKPDSDRQVVEIMARGQAVTLNRLPAHLIEKEENKQDNDEAEALKKLLGRLIKRMPSRDERVAEEVARMVRMTNGMSRRRERRDDRDWSNDPWDGEDSAASLLCSLLNDVSSSKRSNSERSGRSSDWFETSNRTPKVRFAEQGGLWNDGNDAWFSSLDWDATGKGKAKEHSIEDALIEALSGSGSAGSRGLPSGFLSWDNEDEKPKERPLRREREFTWS